ncbi:MAG: hypothetical protein AAFR53_06995 [Pseudomonadota bacterium]
MRLISAIYKLPVILLLAVAALFGACFWHLHSTYNDKLDAMAATLLKEPPALMALNDFQPARDLRELGEGRVLAEIDSARSGRLPEARMSWGPSDTAIYVLFDPADATRETARAVAMVHPRRVDDFEAWLSGQLVTGTAAFDMHGEFRSRHWRDDAARAYLAAQGLTVAEPLIFIAPYEIGREASLVKHVAFYAPGKNVLAVIATLFAAMAVLKLIIGGPKTPGKKKVAKTPPPRAGRTEPRASDPGQGRINAPTAAPLSFREKMKIDPFDRLAEQRRG